MINLKIYNLKKLQSSNLPFLTYVLKEFHDFIKNTIILSLNMIIYILFLHLLFQIIFIFCKVINILWNL